MLPTALAALFLALAAPPADFPALGKEIAAIVEEHFYDAARARQWAVRNASYAAGLTEAESFHRATRERLQELATSHTQYYTPDDVGYHQLLAIFEAYLQRWPRYESIGADLVEREGQEGGWFVARTFPGSPAETAGLLRGDRIATAQGAPFSPLRAFRGKAGREVMLGVERKRGEPLLQVPVVPREVHPKDEWLAAEQQSFHIATDHGHRIAYALLWVCGGEEPQRLLAEALAGPLAGAEALVLDFRGGWGGCDPSFLNLFNPTAPELTRIDRQGHRETSGPSWKKPLVLLVDGGSRSGKEVVARAIQRHRLGTLVGERTATAVVAGQPFLLSDGSLLLLATSDIRVDGERLEGVGVEPEVRVPAELPYAQGRDPQLERALEIAGRPAAPAAPAIEPRRSGR